MICPNCGAALANDTKFCNICGAQQPQPQQPQFQQPVYQQPTYAQQVYRDRQTAMQHDAPQQPVSQKPKKKFPVLALVIVLAVLVVAAAVLLLTTVLGKKTVYLMTEQVTENQISVTTYTYEYTEDGKLTFYQMEVEYTEDYSHLEDTVTSITYNYDKKGNLQSLEYELNGESYEYEYIYDDDGHLKTLEGDDQEFKIKCDEDGRITSVKSADDESFSGKYSYHDNGVLKKVSIVNGSVETEHRYNEQGKVLSSTTSYNGRTLSSIENEYDEEGRQTENAVGSYSDGELLQTTTISYGYETGLFLKTYGIEVSMEGFSVELIFETEDEGLERTFELADIEVSGMEMPEDLAEEMEKCTIEMVYDEQGNLLELDMSVDEMGFSTKTSTSYVAVKVPKNYAMIYQEPFYFLAIDPSHGAPAVPAADVPMEAPVDAEPTP